MRYRVKRVGKAKYYAEWSRFGIFWRSCYNDENLLSQTWKPHIYATFEEAVIGCNTFEAARIGHPEPVEIINLE